MGIIGIAALGAVLSLPMTPPSWAEPCHAVGVTGIVNPSRGSVYLTSSDTSMGGSALLHFALGGYQPTKDIRDGGPMLVMQLDAEPPIYTNLVTPAGHGEFDVGFTNLAQGMHSLGVALSTKASGSNTPYIKVCFETR